MLIAGVDEAGRGPMFGPMVLGITVIEKADEEFFQELGVKDSKVLTESTRDQLEPQIKKRVKEFVLTSIQAVELDALMIRYSLNEIEAMKIAQALNSLKNKPEIVFIDSPDPLASNFAERIKKYISFNCILRSEHKADQNHVVCSAASVLAKVERDRQIKALHKIHGNFGSGYPSDENTVNYLRNWLKKNNKVPEFCRVKWESTQRLLTEKMQTKLF